MARVIIFEDDPYFISGLESALAEGGHEVTAQASTIQGALTVVRGILDKVIETDFIVVDGNLRDKQDRVEVVCANQAPETIKFTYEHVGEYETVQQRDKPWKRKRDVRIPKISVFELERGYQAHGRLILRIVHQTGIRAKTIGFSMDPFENIPVNKDDLHKRSWMINEAINELSK